MRTDQYALYRVDPNKAGKELWRKSYDQVMSENRQIWIGLYRQIHISHSQIEETIMDIWGKIADIREVSDVIVLNRTGKYPVITQMRICPGGLPDLSGSIQQGRL